MSTHQPFGTHRQWRVCGLWGAILVVGGLTVSATSVSASYGPPGAPQADPSFAEPLTGSVTGSATTWTTVVMGKNDGDFNLFWQLFTFNPTTGRFNLVTPPGVADNGGLMVAPTASGTSALVGFGTSQDLTFSPLALTTNSGRAWSQGGLADALYAAPSVVAFDSPLHALAGPGR